MGNLGATKYGEMRFGKGNLSQNTSMYLLVLIFIFILNAFLSSCNELIEYEFYYEIIKISSSI